MTTFSETICSQVVDLSWLLRLYSFSPLAFPSSYSKPLLVTRILCFLKCLFSLFIYVLNLVAPGARNYRPSFREKKPKTLVFSHTKRAFWACFCEYWVYNFGHGSNLREDLIFFCYFWLQLTSPAPLPSERRKTLLAREVRMMAGCDSLREGGWSQ